MYLYTNNVLAMCPNVQGPKNEILAFKPPWKYIYA